MNVYFADIFNVNPDVIEDYGALNISLINDLPLFIDPFLLFNSTEPKYQALHMEMLEYVTFLRDMSVKKGINPGLLKEWFHFSEVRQNWLGYSEIGNSGRGLGKDFALALNRNLNQIFANFGKETITQSSHLEKLCLIKSGVGKDNISDFTTNLIKKFLLNYTQTFAKKYIKKKMRKIISIDRVYFNYATRSWVTAQFELPTYNDDFVILTPKDILTKDDTWINKSDIVKNFKDIVDSVPNAVLRAKMDQYFLSNLPERKKKDKDKEKKPTTKEIATAIGAVIGKFPAFIDYYIRFKEDKGDEAKSISESRVEEVESLFIKELSLLIDSLNKKTDFYSKGYDSLDESYERLMFLKDVIENKDGYRVFYVKGKPIQRESDLHVMFRLTWFASLSDVSPETNDGRGPVDFKISRGSHDKSLVEFKLASNTNLSKNLQHQVEIYKKAHGTDKAIKAILFFSLQEKLRVEKIVRELNLEGNKYVVLIDARRDNKLSASKVNSH